jgi:hypothetical protein
MSIGFAYTEVEGLQFMARRPIVVNDVHYDTGDIVQVDDALTVPYLDALVASRLLIPFLETEEEKAYLPAHLATYVYPYDTAYYYVHRDVADEAAGTPDHEDPEARSVAGR